MRAPLTTGPLAVVDVDGVLADVAHRIHFLQESPKNWGAFFAAAYRDPPVPRGVDLAHLLATGFRLAYLTGRPEGLRHVTEHWLRRHGLPPGPLWMRPRRDLRAARVMKPAVLRQLAGPEQVAVVVDDDPEAVAALRAAGYAVLHAAWAKPGRAGPAAPPAWAVQPALFEAQETDGRT